MYKSRRRFPQMAVSVRHRRYRILLPRTHSRFIHARHLSEVLGHCRGEGIQSRGLHSPPDRTRSDIPATAFIHRSSDRGNMRDSPKLVPSALYFHHRHNVPQD